MKRKLLKKYQNPDGPINNSTINYTDLPVIDYSNYDPGSITQGPTTGKKYLEKTKDISRALGAFVPFLGTALDTYDAVKTGGNFKEVISGANGDMADAINWSTRKVGNTAERMPTRVIPRTRGKVRSALLHNTNKSLGKTIGKIGRSGAKTLGFIGMVLDTPNMVSDIENLKRVLGFKYNEDLILK